MKTQIKNIILALSILLVSISNVNAFSSNPYAPNNPSQIFNSNYQNVQIDLEQSYAQQEYYKNQQNSNKNSMQGILIISSCIGMIVVGTAVMFALSPLKAIGL